MVVGASCLQLLCINYGWKHTFYTSEKESRYYEEETSAGPENDGSRQGTSISEKILWNYEYACHPSLNQEHMQNITKRQYSKLAKAVTDQCHLE